MIYYLDRPDDWDQIDGPGLLLSARLNLEHIWYIDHASFRWDFLCHVWSRVISYGTIFLQTSDKGTRRIYCNR